MSGAALWENIYDIVAAERLMLDVELVVYVDSVPMNYG